MNTDVKDANSHVFLFSSYFCEAASLEFSMKNTVFGVSGGHWTINGILEKSKQDVVSDCFWFLWSCLPSSSSTVVLLQRLIITISGTSTINKSIVRPECHSHSCSFSVLSGYHWWPASVISRSPSSFFPPHSGRWPRTHKLTDGICSRFQPFWIDDSGASVLHWIKRRWQCWRCDI